MKKFSNFNEELKMSEIDVLSDILDSIEMLADESFDSNEEILDEVSKLLSQIGLSFDKEEVMKAVEAGEDIELPLVDSDSEETTLEVFVDESLGKKIDGDIVLRVEIGDDEKIKPSVMIYFDDESAQELSDVEFEPVDDSEEEDESLNEDPHKEMPYDFYGWITQNEIVDLTEIGGARTHVRFPKKITDKYGIEGNHDLYDFNEINSKSYYKKNYVKGFLRWIIWHGKITFGNSLFDDVTNISEKQMKLIQALCKKYDDYISIGIRIDFQKYNNYDKPFKNFGVFLNRYKMKIEKEATLEEDKHGQMSYDFYGWITQNELVDLTEIDGARSHTVFSPETAEEYGLTIENYTDEDSIYDGLYKKGFIRWHVYKGYLTIENSRLGDKTDISEEQINLMREIYKKYEDYFPHGIRIDFRNDQNYYEPFRSFSEFYKAYKHEKDPNALMYGKQKTMTANEGKMKKTNKKFSDLLTETEENIEELKEKEEKEEEVPEVEDEEKDEKEPEEDDDDEKDVDDDDEEDKEEESKVEKHLKKAVKEFGKELDKTDEELTDEMIDTLTMSLKVELEAMFNGESEEEEEEQPSMDDMGAPEEETPEGESLETLEKQDQNSDVIIYEAANKNIFNVILFKPTTRLIISRLIEAGSEKSIEKIVKDEYPEFIVQYVSPVTEFMFQS